MSSSSIQIGLSGPPQTGEDVIVAPNERPDFEAKGPAWRESGPVMGCRDEGLSCL